jgi:hypothetical protein
MSEPMIGLPFGITKCAQVSDASLPAGKSTNKSPILISGFDNTRAFLA